jgi:hypothetical protein
MTSPSLSKLALTIDDTFLPPDVVSMIASESNSHWFSLNSTLRLDWDYVGELTFLFLEFRIVRKGMTIFQIYLSTPWIGIAFDQCRKQLNSELRQLGGVECKNVQASLNGDLLLRFTIPIECRYFHDRFMIDKLFAVVRNANPLRTIDPMQYASAAYTVIDEFTTLIIDILKRVVPTKYGQLQVTNTSDPIPLKRMIQRTYSSRAIFENVEKNIEFRIFSDVGWQRDFLTMMLWSIPEPIEFLEKTKSIAVAAKNAQLRDELPMITQQLLRELETASNTPLPSNTRNAEVEEEDL